MSSQNKGDGWNLGFWEKNIPWTFRDNENKPSYEERRNMRYNLQDYMHSVIGFQNYKGKQVLDVGSGSGIDAVEFARHGAIVTAVDATRNGTFATQDTFREAGLEGLVKQATAENIPFPNNSFDLVYCFGVLHHIEKPEAALREFARVLKDDGLVICMLYHKDSLLYAYSIQHLGLEFERVPGVPFARAYTKDEARNLFLSFFHKCSIEAYYNVVDLPNRRKVKLAIPNELQLGWHLIIEASQKR